MPTAAGRFLPQLLFAVLFTLMEISAQDTELDAAATKVAGPCDEAAYLSKLLKGWKWDLGEKLDAVKLHEEDALTARLAAAENEDDMGSRARAALALLSENRARKARATAEIAKAKLEPAIETLTSRVAAVIAVSKAAPGDVKDRKAASAVGDPTELASTSAECPITFTMTSAADTCDLSKIAGTEINSLSLDTKTKKKVKLLQDTFFEPTPLKVRALAHGNAATASGLTSTTGGHCHGNSTSGVIKSETVVLTAMLTAEPGNTRQPTAVENNTGKSGTPLCVADENNPSDANPTLKHTLHVICQASNFQSRTAERTISEEGPTLAADGDMQNIARFLLFSRTEMEAIPVAEQATKIQEKIKSVYGDKNGEFKKNYLQPLQEKQLTFKLGSHQESKSINAIAQGSDAEIVLSYFLGQQYDQNQRKEANTTSPTKEEKTDAADKTEENKKEGDNKTTAAECKATEADKCDKEKCTWNKK
uniref:Variant surface glycoprotein 698 n=1 Tax=Trypanosoma brucei TaxID=5691 RepID=M4TAE0_9TRYP|nr:variant surface glycoprotein 698 [Trypanosoma brucei]